VEPKVPVVCLPFAGFGPVEAAAALEMALEKADASPIPALRGKVASLDVVVDAMQEATKLRKL
jgi:hypothetical protein